ncbi:MAG: ATP-binding cassette domain-containing protein, partial [Mariprofundaceae bacterium]
MTASKNISIRGLKLWYKDTQALHGIDLNIAHNKVTSFIGPSGCGKSTLLRCLNRMNDRIPHCRIEGDVLLDKKISMMQMLMLYNCVPVLAWCFKNLILFPKVFMKILLMPHAFMAW